MTYDPDRDAKEPSEMNPTVRPADRSGGMSMGLWVGILAALAVATFLMFNMVGNDNVVADRPLLNPSSTTGSGNTNPTPADRDADTNAPAPNPRQ
jgi:hypothetical protein